MDSAYNAAQRMRLQQEESADKIVKAVGEAEKRLDGRNTRTQKIGKSEAERDLTSASCSKHY